jgi:replicative DNA helicase
MSTGKATIKRPARRNAEPEQKDETPIFDRAPPTDIEAEINVLGSIMILPTVADDVALLITREDFFEPNHAHIFDVLMFMNEKGRGGDSSLLVDELKRRNVYEEIGGAGYLGKVMNAVPTAAHARYYAEIIMEKATLRRLIESSTGILREAYSNPENVQEVVARAEAAYAGVAEKNLGGEPLSAATIFAAALDELEERMRTGKRPGLTTQFAKLDEILRGGLHEGLTIIAGRPSMGKTALATRIAVGAALAGEHVYFQSLEMNATELAERMLCCEAQVNSHRVANGWVGQDDRERLIQTAGELTRMPLYVDDNASRTVTQIAAQARRLKRKSGLSLVVVDYLQLIEPDNPRDPREQQVSRMSRRLKALSREISCPVVVLAQLNRKAEDTRDNRPRLSHLRESGAIEQDADVVIFPYREEYYSDDPNLKGLADLIVAKQRNGPTGEAKVCWRADFARFDNLAEQRFEDLEPAAATRRSQDPSMF